MLKKLIQVIKKYPVIAKYQTIHAQLPRDMRRNVCVYWRYSTLISHLENAEHQAIATKIQSGNSYQCSFYLYIYAKSLFLQGKYAQAEKCLDGFLEVYPNYADAIYLKSEILAIQDDKKQAWRLLETLLLYSKRKKTWQMLANLVGGKSDFDSYFLLFRTYFPMWKNNTDYNLVEYLSTVAMRANETDFAVALWRSYYKKSLINPMLTLKKPTKRYTDKLASKALSDFKKQMDVMRIPFFLISGTLLGCIRENALLGHDKDIDVGIWEQENLEQFIKKLRTSGYFYVLPNHNTHIIVVRHVNGVTIDIFVHYRDVGSYWHAGGKSRWDNTPFELTHRLFLGDEYLIPKDYERYLSENYGADWRIPKTDFDSALDTPNMRIIDEKAMLIYLYKKCIGVEILPKKYLTVFKKLGV